MSGLNGFHGAEHYSRFTETEWAQLRRCASGEIEPGHVASLLKRVISNFEYLSAEDLRERCWALCECRSDYGI